MKKFNFGFFAIALVLVASVAQAGSVRMSGDVGVLAPGTASGVIEMRIDLDAEDTLSAGGGVDFAVLTGTPGIVEFTSAAISDGASSWDVRSALIQNAGQRVQFNTTALFAAGLPLGAQNHLLATINYNVLNAAGSTTLAYDVPPVAAIVDGTNAVDADRTAAYTFVPNNISFVPEPGSMALVGMSLVGLAFRRRNG